MADINDVVAAIREWHAKPGNDSLRLKEIEYKGSPILTLECRVGRRWAEVVSVCESVTWPDTAHCSFDPVVEDLWGDIEDKAREEHVFPDQKGYDGDDVDGDDVDGDRTYIGEDGYMEDRAFECCVSCDVAVTLFPRLLDILMQEED